jgi:hypothetical protein
MRGPTPKDALSTDSPTSVILPFASALPMALKVVVHAVPELAGSKFELNPLGELIQVPEVAKVSVDCGAPAPAGGAMAKLTSKSSTRSQNARLISISSTAQTLPAFAKLNLAWLKR